MITLDRIRLTGLLQKSPAHVGLFHRSIGSTHRRRRPSLLASGGTDLAQGGAWTLHTSGQAGPSWTIDTIAAVERAVHDRGGWPTDASIERTEHELADWELLMDAIVGALGGRGVMNVDELRRAIETMEPDAYEAASYYERWLFAAETVLLEKGVLEHGELDARVAR